MVTPDLLRYYPLFSIFNPEQLKNIAQIAEEATFGRGVIIFQEGGPAEAVFILLRGSVELYFTVEVEYKPELRKELFFDVIKPGEVFGISALIQPNGLTATARVAHPSRVVRIDAGALLALCEQDDEAAFQLMHRVAQAAMERLRATRLQLGAALAGERLLNNEKILSTGVQGEAL
ncbi:MAG TPA: cyclic nucleotide-binding domain-containing protein [Anaerolineales bacterium]